MRYMSGMSFIVFFSGEICAEKTDIIKTAITIPILYSNVAVLCNWKKAIAESGKKQLAIKFLWEQVKV